MANLLQSICFDAARSVRSWTHQAILRTGTAAAAISKGPNLRTPASPNARRRNGQDRYTRRTSLLAVSLLTCVVFSVDKLLLEWLPGAIFDWVSSWGVSSWGRLPLSVLDSAVGSDTLLFGVIGFCAAYIFLYLSPQQVPRRKKGCGASVAASGAGAAQKCPPLGGDAGARAGAASPAGSESPSGYGKSPKSTKFASVARLNYAVSQAASRDGAEKAGEVLRSLEDQGWESDVTSYNLVVRSFIKHGDVKSAEKWVGLIWARGEKPNDQTFNLLMGACAKDGDPGAAEVWMSRMVAAGFPPTSVSYATMVHAHARRGDESRACAWLQKMSDAGFEPQCVTYNSLIHACSVNRDVVRAEYWYNEMRTRGLQPTVMTFTGLVDTCAKSLDVRGAEVWMERMLAQDDVSANVVSFSTMIDACARVGDVARAEHWHGRMDSQGVRANAYIYSALINACARAGNVEAACAWLDRAEVSGDPLDAVVYGCVINACGKAGDCERAMGVFDKMRANRIRSHVIVYGALARPFAYRGDWQQVERIAEEMSADGIAINDYFLYTMLLGYARAKPPRPDRAEVAFCSAMESGLSCNDRLAKVLANAVGRTRAAQLLQKQPVGGQLPRAKPNDRVRS